MKYKNIYIIRHGETDYNKKKMVQGRGVDADLNETGRAQAKLFFDAYKNVPFDKIYTSSLVRTQQSVQGFTDLGISTEGLTGLDEISWGDHEGMPYDEVRHQAYLEGLEEWRKGNLTVRVGGGENPIEVSERQKEAMDHILSGDEENILIAMHGRAMRIMLCWLTDKPLQEAEGFEHSNLCLYKLKYQADKFEIVLSADTSHMRSV